MHDIDPDEYALVTSPCLSSLSAICEHLSSSGMFSFNLEALRHMVASKCARNLTHVCLPSKSKRLHHFEHSLEASLNLFLDAVPPLETLILDVDCGPATLEVICRRHGPMLRKLHLSAHSLGF